MIQQKKYRRKKAFTLMEMLLYIALSAFVFFMIIETGLSVVTTFSRSKAQRDLNENARFVLEFITQKIHQADDVIVGSSTFGTHPGVLTLDYPGSGTDVLFETYTKNISLPNGSSYNLRKLRIKEGTASYQNLTNDKVDVTNFVVRNLTRGSEAKNINIEITFQYFNPQNIPEYNLTYTVETAVSLRK